MTLSGKTGYVQFSDKRLILFDISPVINNFHIKEHWRALLPGGHLFMRQYTLQSGTMNHDNARAEKTDPFTEENISAEQFIQAGDHTAAARILVSVVEKDPQNWRAFNNMGIISWERSAWEDAYTTFSRACEIKPGYSDALVNLFDAALKLRRVKESLPHFKKALELDPGNEEIAIIVESIESQGDDIYTSERALSIGIYNPQIEEANKLLEDGQLQSAMEKYLAVNDAQGPSSEVFNGLGIISYYQKRYKDAFSLFYESIKLNPLDADTYLNFIDAAKECGYVEDAKKVYELYCKEFPALKKIEDEFNALATF